MNERIRGLIEEATMITEVWNDEVGTKRYYQLNEEKFAELLIQDVCKIIKGNKLVEPLGGYTEWDQGYNASVKSAIDQVKRKYKKPKKKSGVEE